tara:strand:+ start:101562 stop:101678 length:117 start_codon:yes stop_codon:yes gene_type:complete
MSEKSNLKKLEKLTILCVFIYEKWAFICESLLKMDFSS